MSNNNKNIKNMNTNTNTDTNINANTNGNINEINKIVHDYHENTMKPQFNFYKDFEMIENIQNIQNKSSSNTSNIDQNQINETNELNMILKSFPLVNENIRNNIKLSMEIYKKICNFDYYCVHEAIDENMKK